MGDVYGLQLSEASTSLKWLNFQCLGMRLFCLWGEAGVVFVGQEIEGSRVRATTQAGTLTTPSDR
jgi:hypothetical protein